MADEPKQVTIHLSRIGKPERSYQEGFVDDDGTRLKTSTILPEKLGLQLSEKFYQEGRFLQGQKIHSVSKTLFYKAFFSIVAYSDGAGNNLGYYCDIVTPLQRKGDEYFLTDLILDLWVYPDHRMLELDRDEFEAAVSNGTFPSKFRKDALAAMSKLKADVEEGIFPGEYVA